MGLTTVPWVVLTCFVVVDCRAACFLQMFRSKGAGDV